MRIYLVRHGDAVAKEVDPERPLSARGRAEVQRVAAWLGRAGVRVDRIVHSGKTRAQETAELLAEVVAAGRSVSAVEGLAPDDSVEAFAATITEWTEDVMVVSHLPFIGCLAAYLIVGEGAASLFRFPAGTVACLSRVDAEGWAVSWMIPPALAPVT